LDKGLPLEKILTETLSSLHIFSHVLQMSKAHVVAFLGASIAAPKLAIILEFMPGGSLYRAIHRRRRNNLGAFPLLKSLWIAFGIAKGMSYLHAQYPVIIHRDLKSPNILLGTNVREVKITDFGLSRLRVASFVNTGPGGTPEWMAPELLRQDPFDEQSDVFSFGVILWELIMCEKPWRDDHPMQIGKSAYRISGNQVGASQRELILTLYLSPRPQFSRLALRTAFSKPRHPRYAYLRSAK
jgi:serine/threonine protein kinase